MSARPRMVLESMAMTEKLVAQYEKGRCRYQRVLRGESRSRRKRCTSKQIKYILGANKTCTRRDLELTIYCNHGASPPLRRAFLSRVASAFAQLAGAKTASSTQSVGEHDYGALVGFARVQSLRKAGGMQVSTFLRWLG